jgi:hypothetical protein
VGGKDNFGADRAAADEFVKAMPGIRQFLDIGTGLPSANNTHEVAQQAAPDGKVLYVDNVARFLDGLTVLEPGLVQYPQWRPAPDAAPAEPVPAWCALAIKQA